LDIYAHGFLVALVVVLSQLQAWQRIFFKFNNPHLVVMPKRKKVGFMVVGHQLLLNLLGHNLDLGKQSNPI
jgi:hypothetical protein